MRVFSGIQATGAKQIGNYIGAMRQYVSTQDEGEAFFCIVDMHSITTEYDPTDLHVRTLDLAALLYAVGLDPERCTLFLQSHVTAHAEAAWLLSAVTGFGQLGRMTQFKEKGEGKEFVAAGLFTYPVLMAGDILLYQTDIVPVGDDQRQHVELARDIAQRFNSRFGETFKVPKGVFPEVGARIMDLQEPTKKMSTSNGTLQGTVLVLDPPDVIRKKFKVAVTDSGREVQYSPDEKPGVSNLIEILAVSTGRPIPEVECRLRRARLRRPEERHRRGSGRAVRPHAGPLRRVAYRRGRTAPVARSRRRESARNLGADARGDVRTDGIRAPLTAFPHCDRSGTHVVRSRQSVTRPRGQLWGVLTAAVPPRHEIARSRTPLSRGRRHSVGVVRQP